MTMAASVNGVTLARKLTGVRKIPAKAGTIQWENGEGAVIREQRVIKCEASDWRKMIAANKSLGNWAVVEFGPDIVAVSPMSKIGRRTAAPSRN